MQDIEQDFINVSIVNALPQKENDQVFFPSPCKRTSKKKKKIPLNGTLSNTFVKDFVICFGKLDFACFHLSNHIKISPTAETPKIIIILPIISQEEHANLEPIS